MGKKLVTLMAIFVMIVGGAILEPTITQAAEEEKGIPVIVQSFAPKELAPGDVWKVYLKATDPDGKMKYILATISQPGVGSYPVSITKIKDENQKELSGYIYLKTDSVQSSRLFNLTLTLTVNIKDDKGQFSKSSVFPLSFVAKPSPEAPPEGAFSEQDLGPIMVTLRTVEGGGRRR
jgi:hypothetical protein